MKKILLSYLVIAVVLIGFCTLLSHGQGAGYVYLLFHGWQIQGSFLGFLLFTLLVSLCIQLIGYMARRYANRKKRIHHQVESFSNLHPYEKLGILWLLGAERQKQTVVENIFTASTLLNHLIQAAFLRQQGQYDAALKQLEQSPPVAFELVTLQRIEVYLLDGQGEDAFAHLELLSSHPLQPVWLKELEEGYQQRLGELWSKFAIQFPWLYLYATQCGTLTADANTIWLTQILETFDQAVPEQLEKLQQRYLDLKTNHIDISIRTNKVLWLKVLMRLPDMQVEYEELATSLLNDMFDQDVFFMWFEQRMLGDDVNYNDIEKQVMIWEKKYSDMPIFYFVKWHIFQKNGKYKEAEELLSKYPDHVLLSYLRIKVHIQDNPILVQQLKNIFEANPQFLKINI